MIKFIIGLPGTGKSTLLGHLVSKAIQHRKPKGGIPIAISMDLCTREQWQSMSISQKADVDFKFLRLINNMSKNSTIFVECHLFMLKRLMQMSWEAGHEVHIIRLRYIHNWSWYEQPERTRTLPEYKVDFREKLTGILADFCSLNQLRYTKIGTSLQGLDLTPRLTDVEVLIYVFK